MEPVTKADIQRAAGDLKLSGRPLCVHSSLRSFGRVDGGAQTVIDGLLAEGCTVMVPTFSYEHEIPAPPGRQLPRNGNIDRAYLGARSGPKIFSPEENDVSGDMGAIPRALLQMPARDRGLHPIDSFSAVGPLAEELIRGQTATDVYAPFQALIEHDGFVLLIGVGLTRMTLIHDAERMAGRNLFRRWAYDANAEPLETLVGGCSEGFFNLEPAIGYLARETMVGQSRWRAFPAGTTREVAAQTIRENPEITRCPDPTCAGCPDSIAGGPVV